MIVSVSLCFLSVASADEPLPSDRTGTSQGYYSRGSLNGGIPVADEGPDHILVFPARCYVNNPRYPDPDRADNYYGHPRVVETLLEVARSVRQQHRDAPRLPIAELSNRRGGRIPNHLSHQNGLDVDIDYLSAPLPGRGLTDGPRRCQHGPSYEERDPQTGEWAVPSTFVARWNWALAAELAAQPSVRVIFVGTLVRKRLEEWARTHGISRRERRRTMRKLHPVFCRPPAGRQIDRYRGNFCPHDDHFHVRFRCPADSRSCRTRR